MQKKLKVSASIEARMTSSRLPGKVLMPAIDDISMLEYMVKRVEKSTLIDEVIIATTINKTDDPIIELCEKLNIKYYRGSENDVLQRVLEAHLSIDSDVIVELTGDCPIIDPIVIDKVVAKYLENDYDYVSNGHIRSYPDGFDVQIFSTKLLTEVEKLATDLYDRENVSSYIYKGDTYKLQEVVAEENEYWPELRVTLDDTGDYLLIKEIIKHFHEDKNYDYTVKEVVEYVKSNMHLLDLNKDARVTDTLYVKTLKND
jgi:spore coat polysaccharide biosynthesis protein SpsF